MASFVGHPCPPSPERPCPGPRARTRLKNTAPAGRGAPPPASWCGLVSGSSEVQLNCRVLSWGSPWPPPGTPDPGVGTVRPHKLRLELQPPRWSGAPCRVSAGPRPAASEPALHTVPRGLGCCAHERHWRLAFAVLTRLQPQRPHGRCWPESPGPLCPGRGLLTHLVLSSCNSSCLDPAGLPAPVALL